MTIEFVKELTTGADLAALKRIKDARFRREYNALEQEYNEACSIAQGLHQGKASPAYRISAAILDELKEEYKEELAEAERQEKAWEEEYAAELEEAQRAEEARRAKKGA